MKLMSTDAAFVLKYPMNREWLMCSCNRRVHVDCIDPDDVDDSSKLSPLC